MYEVLGDDLLHIAAIDVTVPDGLGIDDDYGTVLALVETAGVIGADGTVEACRFDGVLEG